MGDLQTRVSRLGLLALTSLLCMPSPAYIFVQDDTDHTAMPVCAHMCAHAHVYMYIWVPFFCPMKNTAEANMVLPRLER